MSVYFISGVSRGIGYELARQLLAGSPTTRIIGTARDVSSLAKLSEEFPSQFTPAKLDFDTDFQDQIKAITLLPEIQDGIDVLINNAGVLYDVDTSTTASVELLRKTMNGNLFGPVELTQSLLPFLKKRESRKIFYASTAAASISLSAIPFVSNYGTSKAALNMFAAKLSAELADEGFTVIPYHPGLVITDMATFSGLDPSAKSQMFNGISVPILTTLEAATEIIRNVFSLGKENTGKFYNYTGDIISW